MIQLNARQGNRLHTEEILANDLEKINNLNCLKFLGLSSEPFQFKKLFKNASILFLCPSLKNPHNRFQKQMDYQHIQVFLFQDLDDYVHESSSRYLARRLSPLRAP